MGKRVYTLRDVLGEAQPFEGEQVPIADILNEPITVLDLHTYPSIFREGEYAVVQAEHRGRKIVFRTGAVVLLKIFKKAKEKGCLPLRLKIVKRKRYYEAEEA